MGITGRKKEIDALEKLYRSGKSEFVAIYGRRRVGKTFLVKEVFKERFTFCHTGLSPVEGKRNMMRDQLQAFHYSLLRAGADEESPCPETWIEAFYRLEKLLSQRTEKRKVVFFDELPWMDTARSGFVTALEHFWNGWVAGRSDIMLVVCGSSTSWILNNLVNNNGGLYDRLTYEIKLFPFTLSECEEYYRANNICLDRYDIAQSYMILGGIPYYMGYFSPGESLAQNIDRILFAKGAPLAREFDRLFRSLFKKSEDHVKIVKVLATKHFGYTRDEISQKTGISLGGGLSERLKDLVEADFVARYEPCGQSRTVYYRLCDNFCLFYMKYLQDKGITNPGFWQHSQNTPAVASWRGLAFEHLCFSHIPQIKKALGVSGVVSKESSMIIGPESGKSGAQIDLIIERADRVVNICEMKFYNRDYKVDKDEKARLEKRIMSVQEGLYSSYNIHMTLITVSGLEHNAYSGIFQNVITLDDLFEK